MTKESAHPDPAITPGPPVAPGSPVTQGSPAAPGSPVTQGSPAAPGSPVALAPLVDPGPALSAARIERYSRTISLPGFGDEAQRRIRAARALVVGAGGLGSAVIPALAAAGFGTIGVIDDDTVESSNLPRQTIHAPTDVGRRKVASARDTIADLDADARVVVFDTALTAQNALEIFADFDLVIDGSDNFPTRYLVDDAASLSGIPVVWGAVHQFGGQVGVSWTTHGPGYRDLFPAPPEPGSVASCAEAGALPSVCVVIGGLMVTEAIKLVTGHGGALLGRVIVHDGLRGTFREVRYEKDPLAEPVTELIDYDQFCGAASPAPTLAERTGGTLGNRDLQELIALGEPIVLIDVREPWEAHLASIPRSNLVPLGDLEADIADDAEAVASALRDATVVVYCHYGPRADRARSLLVAAGVPNTVTLTGGIDAWAREIDPDMARY